MYYMDFLQAAKAIVQARVLNPQAWKCVQGWDKRSPMSRTTNQPFPEQPTEDRNVKTEIVILG